MSDYRRSLSGHFKASKAPDTVVEHEKEIFGRRSGTVREPGLVDCLTEQDFQHQRDLPRPVWEKRHVKGKQFNEYFVRQKAPLILSCMGAATRMMAGLGYPPEVYTQNGSECGNFILKDCKNQKKIWELLNVFN